MLMQLIAIFFVVSICGYDNKKDETIPNADLYEMFIRNLHTFSQDDIQEITALFHKIKMLDEKILELEKEQQKKNRKDFSPEPYTKNKDN